MAERRAGWKRLCFKLGMCFFVLAFMGAPVQAELTVQDLESMFQNQFGVALDDLANLDLSLCGNRTMTCPVEFDLLAKAQPDECFYGRCSEDNFGTDQFPCPEISGIQGVPKVNQAYVWGMTMAGDGKIWFGTVPNTHCLVLATYLGINFGMQTPSYACELGQCETPLGPLGDWRSPEIYAYDPATGSLTEHTPNPVDMGVTVGIRSAGSLDNIVFLGGPAVNQLGEPFVKLFAYTGSGTYLGSANLNDAIVSNPGIDTTNIRKWLAVNGHLYTAIGSRQGGFVLKWVNDPQARNYPFEFQVVGSLDEGSGAELAYHEGRIFVSTWPGAELTKPIPSKARARDIGDGLAGLFMSPLVPGDGLPESFAPWRKVWQVDDYEPDPITAATYGGGALASFDGYLYWGTMHVPLVSFAAYARVFDGFKGPDEALEAFLGSYRAISIFRGNNFGELDEQIDLLYGMPALPVAVPDKMGGVNWGLVPNKMNALPLFGLSGFGNMFNNYTWSMQVFDGKLWIGTMDWSYLVGEMLEPAVRETIEQALGVTLPEKLANLPTYFYGADLFCMTSSQMPAFPICLSGLGNYTNYGIRNMVADGDRIYFGMANPMNLLTDTTDDMPEGGWELLSREGLEFDGDLIPSDIEDQAPNGGDGNGDGIPDSTQSHVTSMRACGTTNYLTVEVLDGDGSACRQVRGMMLIGEGVLPEDEGFEHPYGDMSVMLQCPSIVGGTATVRIYYHGVDSLDGFVYRKFGMPKVGTSPTWFTYGGAAFGQADVGGRAVAYVDLALKDNAVGDFFLHKYEGDGFILDPGGLAMFALLEVPTFSEWGQVIAAILMAVSGLFFIRRYRRGAA